MSDGRAELGDEDAHTTTCDGCGTADCDNWRWSCFHAVTLCASCADYWQENDGQLPDFEQKKLVTDGGREQHTEELGREQCPECGELTNKFYGECDNCGYNRWSE